MERYSIKQGKYYFKGDKMQSAILQYTSTTSLIVASIICGNWWFLLGALICFFSFFIFLEGEIKMNSVRVFFEKECAYKLTDNFDQVNKLFGFSQGFHHWNSARIGWRCTDGENIELLAYSYINGKRIIKPMIKCKTETWVFCNIQNKPTKYVFKALTPNNQSITVSIDKDRKLSIYSFFKLFIYRLFPYFGGKISAPHDMSLCLTKLSLD